MQGEVHALRRDRRREMTGVPGQQEPPVDQGFDDVVVHVQHPLLDQPALRQCWCTGCTEAGPQLSPDPVVRPVLRVVAGRTLQVVAGDLGAAGHVPGEAVRMDAEQHAVRGGRSLGEQGQPADAVVLPGDPQPLCRYRRPRHPARPVAAGDEVAAQHPPLTRRRAAVRHRRPVRVQVVQPHVLHAETDVAAAYVGVLPYQVRHQQRLRVDEMVPARQVAVVEPVPLAAEAELARVVRLGPRRQVCRQAAPVEFAHGPFLDDARSRAGLDELPALGLQDHAVDGGCPQEGAHGEPGGPGAHDDDRSAFLGCGVGAGGRGDHPRIMGDRRPLMTVSRQSRRHCRG